MHNILWYFALATLTLHVVSCSDDVEVEVEVIDTAYVWFTAQRSNYIGKLTTETGAVQVFEVPVASARPYGIKVDSADRRCKPCVASRDCWRGLGVGILGAHA